MVARVGPPPPEGYVRVRARVSYDGSGFSGFAKQSDVRTIEGVLEDALTAVLRHPAKVNCAGRTDRGVHAIGQVISFDADASHFEATAFARAMNRTIEPEMAIDEIEIVANDFDARLSCTGRSYRYHVLNRDAPDPLRRLTTWHVREPLDIDAMNEACAVLPGLHDFSAFSKRNKSRPDENFLRRVFTAGWNRETDLACFDIHANAFSHQMVRSLVGMFVAIGTGRREVNEFSAVLEGLDRHQAPSPAPPSGLVFIKAHYEPAPGGYVYSG